MATTTHPPMTFDPPDPVPLPINGELDLHTFSPKEVGSLLREYIQECVQRDIFNLRIVHGKGTGTLRKRVVAVLDKHPLVVRHEPGGYRGGGWGATLVELKKSDP
tara:strand:+ start:353 stop:667 length:315 start_codon:yes stop_codon:yes gene_type:complete